MVFMSRWKNGNKSRAFLHRCFEGKQRKLKSFHRNTWKHLWYLTKIDYCGTFQKFFILSGRGNVAKIFNYRRSLSGATSLLKTAWKVSNYRCSFPYTFENVFSKSCKEICWTFFVKTLKASGYLKMNQREYDQLICGSLV